MSIVTVSQGISREMSSGGPVLGFELEWYDPVASDVKKLFLKFWIEDNTLELVSGTTMEPLNPPPPSPALILLVLSLLSCQLKGEPGQAAFLKKIYYPQVRVQDLYLGSSLTMSVLLSALLCSCLVTPPSDITGPWCSQTTPTPSPETT